MLENQSKHSMEVTRFATVEEGTEGGKTMDLLTCETEAQRLTVTKKVASAFQEGARIHDQESTFPFAHIEALKKIGYPSLALPRTFGGLEITLLEMMKHQETIARFDGATALSIGWHVGQIFQWRATGQWKKPEYRLICEQIQNKQILLNSAATEKATGSPARGGKPTTTATKSGEEWVIQGRKTFTSMAPALDYALVTATIAGENEVGQFLVPMNARGVTIDETWNMVGMRATSSHDLVLDHVRLPLEALMERIEPGMKKAAGWLLHIPACYLGISQAAYDEAIRFAKQYSPNTLDGTISTLPHVQQKIGEMAMLLMQSRTILHSVARQWDESSDLEREEMKRELAMAKVTVINNGLSVVDIAMRIVGAHSLHMDHDLQRYYRDMRAGLHNPPSEDMTIAMLAKEALRDE